MWGQRLVKRHPMRISEIPETDRPREKLMERGPSSLTDSELLAIFLRTGTRGKSAIMIAQELIAAKGSLVAISRCTAKQLKGAATGIGMAKAVELAAAVELGKRLAKGTDVRALLDSAQAAYDYFGADLRASDREVLKVVLLDTKLRLIYQETVATGSLNECVAHPREILLPAITHHAYAILLIHNHPSGDPAPSRADQNLTSRLRDAANLMQISLLDHIILGTADGGRQPFFSFREAGIL